MKRSALDVPMFDVPKAPKHRQLPACGQVAPVTIDWRTRTHPATRAPVCNRPQDHDGPHREYRRRDAEVMAEW